MKKSMPDKGEKLMGEKTANEAPEQDNNDSEEGNYAGVEGPDAGGLNKDPNDLKVMATSPDDKPGREIVASLATLNENRNSPILAYYEFPSSKNDVYDTYPTRMEKIASYLGNKDEVRG